MTGRKEIPQRKDLVDYNYAVAGHAGTLCDPDGELFIKPCKHGEIEFYEEAYESHPEFADLMPLFMGMLMLNDALDIQSIDEQLPVVADHISQEMKEQVIAMVTAPAAEPQQPAVAAPADEQKPKDPDAWVPSKGKMIATDRAVVLENAAYGYKRPNILDVKMGVRLYADDAPAEKKQKFTKISNETTHGELGFRIAGMRVYKGSEDPKELDQEDYKIYDKDYGRLHVSVATVVDAFRKFVFSPAAGVDQDLGRAISAAFVEELKRVRDVMEKEESRMYSSSLLFIFEGDGETLRNAVTENNRTVEDVMREKSEQLGRSTARVDSGIDMDEDGELILNGGAGAVAVIAEDEEEDDGADSVENLPKILSLKIIDFAHAQFLPGQGPDENVLKGVRSLIKIFEELAQ